MRKTDATNPPSLGCAARCLILAAAGQPVPDALRQGLRRRAVQCRLVTGPIRAMVELARCPGQALIIIEPEALAHADQLVAAVSRYHPRTALWRFDSNPKPLLRPIGPGSLHTSHQGRVSSGAKPADAGELSGPRRDAKLNSPTPAVHPEPLISEEELAMLLDEDERTEDW